MCVFLLHTCFNYHFLKSFQWLDSGRGKEKHVMCQSLLGSIYKNCVIAFSKQKITTDYDENIKIKWAISS